MKLIDLHSASVNRRKRRASFGSEPDCILSVEAGTLVAKGGLRSNLPRTAKRTADLALALAGGVLLMPLLVAIAVAIKCASRGPVFYGQVRLGRSGRHFRMWKFRTMVPDAERRLDECLLANPELHEEWTSEYKLKDDPRVIPWIGRVLRNSGLDELPQLWNVLLGEMSLVGPRPLPQYHLDQFDEEFRLLRAAMAPGITGQWQVCSRNCHTADMFRKLDTYYVRNWSIWLDLLILSRTPWVVFSREQDGCDDA